MNVSLEKTDAVSAVLKVEIEKNDYADQLDKNLRKLRQQAKMPGFRPGMVPLGYIKRLYGKQALLEEVNKLVMEGMNSYLNENQVRVLGNPIANESVQKKIDFDLDENFEFCFDIALRPEVSFKFTKDDSLTLYRVTIEDEVVEQQVKDYRRQFGVHEIAETVTAEDVVKGVLTELEEGAPKEGGIIVEDATLIPSYLKGKMEQKKFIGANTGKTLVFNPYKAYKGTEVEIASLLRIKKDAVKEMKSDFSFEIKEITHYTLAELNQEFFDKIFGADVVKDEAGFRERIKDFLTSQYVDYNESKLKQDIHDLMIQKVGDVVLADDILKRWLLVSSKTQTMEEVEAGYPKVVLDLKYIFARQRLVNDYDLKVDDEEVEAMAVQVVKSQFAQYGMMTVPAEMLDNYVKELLNKPESVDSMAENVLNEKMTELIRGLITIDEKEVTVEEFKKQLTKNNE